MKSEQTVDCKQSLGFFGIVEWSMQFAIHNGLAPLFLAALLLTTHEIRIMDHMLHFTLPKENNDCSQSKQTRVLNNKHLKNHFLSRHHYLHLFVVSLLQVPNGIGVILGSIQLLLFVLYPSTSQRTITYDTRPKPPKPV